MEDRLFGLDTERPVAKVLRSRSFFQAARIAFEGDIR
jgi:hypothetical protein